MTKLGLENLRMVRWTRWHCPPDTELEIRVLVVWDRAHYLSATEAPHNIEYLRVSGEERFCFFETWITRAWLETAIQAGSFNHCTRAPACFDLKAPILADLIYDVRLFVPLWNSFYTFLAQIVFGLAVKTAFPAFPCAYETVQLSLRDD